MVSGIMTTDNTSIFEAKAGLIYESPDGGKTIYARQPGFRERVLVHEAPEVQTKRRWLQLKEAVELAENNKTLDDAISQVEMIYKLVKDND